jgi:hypothetical protein
MKDILERLQIKDVRHSLGQWSGRLTKIQLWMNSLATSPDDLSEKEIAAQHEIEGFLTTLGLARDQIVRMRTGAAVNEAEDVMFKAIIGSEYNSADQLEATLDATMKAMSRTRGSVWKAALQVKYKTEAEKFYDQIPMMDQSYDSYREMSRRHKELSEQATLQTEGGIAQLSKEEADEYREINAWMEEHGWELEGEE